MRTKSTALILGLSLGFHCILLLDASALGSRSSGIQSGKNIEGEPSPVIGPKPKIEISLFSPTTNPKVTDALSQSIITDPKVTISLSSPTTDLKGKDTQSSTTALGTKVEPPTSPPVESSPNKLPGLSKTSSKVKYSGFPRVMPRSKERINLGKTIFKAKGRRPLPRTKNSKNLQNHLHRLTKFVGDLLNNESAQKLRRRLKKILQKISDKKTHIDKIAEIMDNTQKFVRGSPSEIVKISKYLKATMEAVDTLISMLEDIEKYQRNFTTPPVEIQETKIAMSESMETKRDINKALETLKANKISGLPESSLSTKSSPVAGSSPYIAPAP